MPSQLLKTLGRVTAQSDPERIGAMYQQARPQRDRIDTGQFFTPQPVCDLMLSLALRTGEERVLEPGCGTGNFLLRAMAVLCSHYGRLPPQAFQQLYGVEQDPQAALVALFQLWSYLGEYSHPLPLWGGVHVGNFLDQIVPPPGGYDVVIGNPPYVRHEHRRANVSTSETFVEIVKELKRDYGGFLQKFPQHAPLFSLKADLYVWFLLNATRLLNPGGRLCFILSSSWLDTKTGEHLQGFIQAHYRVLAVMESSRELWFADAAINPVIILAERLEEEAVVAPDHLVRFVRFEALLKDLLPYEGASYWEDVFALGQSLFSKTPPPGVWVQDVPHVTLLKGKGGGISSPWRFALKAPRRLQTLLAESPLPWCQLQDLGTVRYPLKTGINGFFYVTPEVQERFQIESRFLLPVVKSLKVVTSYRVDATELDLFLFSCTLSPQVLAAEGCRGALAYIAWGEAQYSSVRQKNRAPLPWPEVPSVQGRPYWYQIPPLEPPDLLCPRFFDKRFVVPVCSGRLMEDQTFYGLTLSPALKDEATLVAALLNSTLSFAMMESLGRSSLGDGVLQFSKADMAEFPVLDPRALTGNVKEKLCEAFLAMANRSVLPAFEEALQPDRLRLDEIVLSLVSAEGGKDTLELTEGFLSRVRARREKGVGRKKKQVF